jgi:hypothetical protein
MEWQQYNDTRSDAIAIHGNKERWRYMETRSDSDTWIQGYKER